MKYEFRHRNTNAVLATEDIPDDSPRPARTALEQLAMRGQSPDLLRELRAETEGAIEGADEVESKLHRYRIEAIDRELEAPTADANLARANLARANLAGAYLARANLADAYLAGANLADANLAGANLADANLADANLADANLAGANLADAYLAGANLADANLADANLARANLADAYLARANLADARGLPSGFEAKDPEIPYEQAMAQTLAERAKRYRERHPEVPVVEHLDSKILEQLTDHGGSLRMATWHTCNTTHCLGGWSVHLAGPAGYELERKFDVQRAAAMIWQASTGMVPHFFASDEDALEDLKKRAAAQSAPASAPEPAP